MTVTIAGATVPMVLASTTERTACSTSVGDAFPQNVPLTVVPRASPPTLHIAAPGATEIRGAIYDVAAPSPSGGPMEEFTLPGGDGEHAFRSILPARTYRVIVNVGWSFVVAGGEVTYLFDLRQEP